MSGLDVELVVAGVGLWLPGVPSARAWVEGARGSEVSGDYDPPSGGSIDKRTRRRASPLTRGMADAFAEAVAQAGVDAATVPTVFGTALGEASTMLDLLEQLWSDEPMSPMGFATSVPSAASGAVSITSKNRSFTTSICADYDTATGALLEARGLIQTRDTPVVVVCGDERSPEQFVPDEDAFDLLAVALCLGLPHHGLRGLATLRGPRATRTSAAAQPGVSAVRDRVARNPQVGMLDLAAAVLAGRSGVVELDRGRGSGASVILSPPP